MKRVAGRGGNIRLHKITEGLFPFPGTTVPWRASLCNIIYPTAKNGIKILIENGILLPSACESRPGLCVVPEIVKTAFGGPTELQERTGPKQNKKLVFRSTVR